MSDKRLPVSEGTRRRIADDTHLIFMARTMERLYGPDCVDAMVAYLRERQKKNWQERAKRAGGRIPGTSNASSAPTLMSTRYSGMSRIASRCALPGVFTRMSSKATTLPGLV